MRGAARFAAVQAGLYAGFLALDLTCPGSGWDVPLKYAGVVLCFLWACRQGRGRDGRLTQAALAFTLAADLLLLVLNRWYGVGVALFCVVQALYLARIQRADRRPLARRLVLRCLLAAALLAVGGGLGLLNPLTALTLVYFSQLLSNAAAALALGPRGRGFALGLVLFIGCDLCVGLCNLPGGPPAPWVQVGMWLCYLPSQTLIALSAGKLCDD